jgi:acetylornithine deacetylase/succinyl-diaminopimelate desuccinylase-like protein
MNKVDAYDKVIRLIEEDRQELVDLCLSLGNTPSPNGRERAVAEKVIEWFNKNGIRGFLQPITETSCNAVGVIRGTGDGTSLVVNAHLDTFGPETQRNASESAKRIGGAWVDGDTIFGQGVVNDKGQLCAFMVAAKAVNQAGIRLKGDLTIAGVAFETGQPSVDELQGINYPGHGFGTKWLVDRGITADYALVGETSGFGIVRGECGSVRLKVHVKGRFVYTPRLERGKSLGENPDALVKMAHVLLAIDDWAKKYEEKGRREFPWGVMVPKGRVINVRASGGNCDLYVDVYIVPGQNPREIRKEIEQVTSNLGLDCDVTLYDYSRGYVAKDAEPLIGALEKAHRYIFDSEPPTPPWPELSMWRDLNVFNEVGIPSVCYGPSRQKEMISGWQDRAVKISDLVDAAKVYALTMMDLCGWQMP